jgi:hypothetical protein
MNNVVDLAAGGANVIVKLPRPSDAMRRDDDDGEAKIVWVLSKRLGADAIVAVASPADCRGHRIDTNVDRTNL